MLALGRLIVVGFVALTVIYVSLSYYSRAVRRSKLRRKWDEDIQQGDRDAYVQRGLKIYDRSLRRKLLWGVYVVPIVTIAIVIYLVNFA
jgi:Ca2+/Na+ antiporter